MLFNIKDLMTLEIDYFLTGLQMNLLTTVTQ